MNPTSSDYTSPYGYQYLTLLDTLGVLDTLPTSYICKFKRPEDTGVTGVFNFHLSNFEISSVFC